MKKIHHGNLSLGFLIYYPKTLIKQSVSLMLM
jgi:hypothetical protein